MPQFTIGLTGDEAQRLAAVAVAEGTTPEGMIQRWVQQRLIHERERVEGTARPMSPRARRAAEAASPSDEAPSV